MDEELIGWAVMISHQDRHFLTVDARTESVQGFATKKEALDFFHEGYRRSHMGGAQMSTSAAIHWMIFSPVVVPVHSEDQLNSWLLRNEGGAATTYTLSSVAGTMCGVELDPRFVPEINAVGTEVSLVPPL